MCTQTQFIGTKTIGLSEDAYERLTAQRRDGESFGDTVKRLTESVSSDWREGFGRLDDDTADGIAEIVERSRSATGEGLGRRQQRALERMAEDG